MSNKIVYWLAVLGISVQLSACTSSDQKSDVDSAANSDVESLSNPGDAGASAGNKDDALLSDAMSEDTVNKDANGAGATADANKPADGLDAAMNANPPASEPNMVMGDNNATPAAPMDAPPAATDTPPPGMDTAATPPPAEPPPAAALASEPAKPLPPLQKVKEHPFQVGKTWYNGVYFAHPGDTLKSISKTIYGKNNVSVLKKGNEMFKSRSVKPGDKVYYNSPKRPDDSEHMLTWYEDMGQQPETYVAKKGDNLRSLSKKLLGYDAAWKETWASNPMIESKSKLEEGAQVRYWASAAAATPVAVENNAPPAPEQGKNNAELPPPPPSEPISAQQHAGNDLPPPPPGGNDLPPPPPPAQAGMNDLPPPPPPPGGNDLPPPPPPAQAQNDIPPPPPPPSDLPPPPPPPSGGGIGGGGGAAGTMKAGKGKAGAETEAAGMDEDTMMALGTVAVAAAGIAALLVLRRRRKRNEMEAAIHDSTQVG